VFALRGVRKMGGYVWRRVHTNGVASRERLRPDQAAPVADSPTPVTNGPSSPAPVANAPAAPVSKG
jgi:hypothetical protein